MDAAVVFRSNLKRLAMSKGIADLDGLAAALGFDRGERRWLRRLWEDGISRPDPRRHSQMRKLLGYLGVENKEEMWRPYVEPSVSETFSKPVLHGEDLLYVQKIVTAYRQLSQVKRLNPVAYAKAMRLFHHSDELMITAWVNPTSFEGLTDEEFTAAQACFFDRQHHDNEAEEDILTCGERLFGYLNEQFKDSPQWAEYVSAVTGYLEDRFSPSLEMLETLRDQTVYLFFAALAYKTPTLNDLVKQFEDTVLMQSDPAISVINQVRIAFRKHPNRQSLIDYNYGGNEDKYVEELTKRWKLA
jgi:hypothetical protein